jgi:uncharacterized membrane protein
MSLNTSVPIILVFLLGLGIGAVLIWLFLRRKKTGSVIKTGQMSESKSVVGFQWTFIVIPVSLFLLCVLLALLVYQSLPENMAFRFSTDGVPKTYMAKPVFLSVMLGGQLIIVLAAFAVALGIVKFGEYLSKNSTLTFYPRTLIWLMINMLVLPQIILAFVMLDASVYAIQVKHIMAPWLFSLLAIGFGSIVIIFLFLKAINQSRNTGS